MTYYSVGTHILYEPVWESGLRRVNWTIRRLDYTDYTLIGWSSHTTDEQLRYLQIQKRGPLRSVCPQLMTSPSNGNQVPTWKCNQPTLAEPSLKHQPSQEDAMWRTWKKMIASRPACSMQSPSRWMAVRGGLALTRCEDARGKKSCSNWRIPVFTLKEAVLSAWKEPTGSTVCLQQWWFNPLTSDQIVKARGFGVGGPIVSLSCLPSAGFAVDGRVLFRRFHYIPYLYTTCVCVCEINEVNWINICKYIYI